MTDGKLTLSSYIRILNQDNFWLMKWKDDAACVKAVQHGWQIGEKLREYEPLDWFPVEEDKVPIKVQMVCEMCPVRLECLVWAIHINEIGGIWGGKSTKARSRMRRRILTALRKYDVRVP